MSGKGSSSSTTLVATSRHQHTREASLGDRDYSNAVQFFQHDWDRAKVMSMDHLNKQNHFSEHWASADPYEDDSEDEEEAHMHHHHHHHRHHSEEFGMNEELDADAMQAASDVLNLMDFDHPDKRPGHHLDSPNAKRLRLDAGYELEESNLNDEDGKPSSAASKKIHNEQWDAMFERLQAYKATYGNCLVPKRFSLDPKLGTWVETQRVQYKRLVRTQDESTGREIVHPNKRLTADRLQKLESVGFAWVAKFIKKTPTKKEEEEVSTLEAVNAQQQRKQRLNEAQWEDMYQRLVQYKQQYGDCLVPRKFEGDSKLATWVETQRVLWNKEVKSNSNVNDPDAIPITEEAKLKRLTPARKQRLDELGFVWSLRNKRIEDHWDEMFRQLLDYKKVHGDCLVPSRFESNLKLGKWVETQRYEYSKLQKQNAAKDAGGPMSVASSTKSEEDDDDSDDSSSVSSKDSGKPRASNPRLTQERLRRLEAIGFEWKVKNKMKRYYDKQWDQMFQRLLQFKETNGHCRVPKRYAADTKLGTWVHTQRIQYRKLIASKKDGAPPPTEEEVAKLLAGQNPTLTEEEQAAMKSVAKDETTYRLTEDRRKRLEEMGFVWSARDGEKGADVARGIRNTYDDQWDSMFEKLKEYKDKHGNCLVPKRYKDNPKLGTWVDTQRVQYKKLQKILASQGNPAAAAAVLAAEERAGSPIQADETGKPLVGRLTNDRIHRLEGLGFVWSLRDDWQKHFEELKVYKNQHGHCNVPARYEKNRRLGIWVSAQRQQYKMMRQLPDNSKARRSTSLTPDRIQLLNDLGFTWTIRSRDSFGESWNQRFEDLKDFKRIHGHCNVPSKYPENPELGVWVGTQRTQYRLYIKSRESGTLSTSSMNDDRIRALESIGFTWVQRNSRGGSPLDEVLAAAAANGEGMLDVDQMYSNEVVMDDDDDDSDEEYVTQEEL